MARPVKWKNANDMQSAINKYFSDIDLHNLENENKKHPTITGLALALDLTRQGLIEYIEKNEEFSDTIKKAKARVEEYIEQRLYSNNATGCIFNLKNNFGWKDNTQMEIGNKDENPFKMQSELKDSDKALLNKFMELKGVKL